MEEKLSMLIFAIVSIAQISLSTTTTIIPDKEQENEHFAQDQNDDVVEFNMNVADKDTNNFDVEGSSLSPWFERILSALFPGEDLESLPDHNKDNSMDEIHEYSPRSVRNSRGWNRRGNKRNGRRCRGKGQSGHGNRGGYNGNGGGGRYRYGGGSAHPGEASNGISAQAAVIGAGSVISGVSVTT